MLFSVRKLYSARNSSRSRTLSNQVLYSVQSSSWSRALLDPKLFSAGSFIDAMLARQMPCWHIAASSIKPATNPIKSKTLEVQTSSTGQHYRFKVYWIKFSRRVFVPSLLSTVFSALFTSHLTKSVWSTIKRNHVENIFPHEHFDSILLSMPASTTPRVSMLEAKRCPGFVYYLSQLVGRDSLKVEVNRPGSFCRVLESKPKNLLDHISGAFHQFL